VCWNASRSVVTLAVGSACLATAHAPARCGVAIDVPLCAAYVPPRIDDSITSPGARRDRNGAMFENHETSSLLVVEPTLTAEEMHAGDMIADPVKPLPDAATVAMPTDLRLSIIGLYGSLSQGAAKRS